MAEPQFEGQTKTKLGNSEVTGAVQQAVGEALANYLEEHPKEAKMICDKVVLAATARIAARKARESVQRKNPMSGGGLPGKLADCSNKDPKDCEIFLVEGDSAGGSAKQGRDRHFQAILPLRGKILNVEKVQWHRVFEAESVMNIIQSIGVRFGVDGEGDKEANIDKLRYDKIIIMTDADVDGSHIDTLIMTLFYRFMPRIIQEGHLYIATPPLYKCTYKKVSEYCYTEQQRQAFIDKYVAGDENSSALHTQRYKGLGEMNQPTSEAGNHREFILGRRDFLDAHGRRRGATPRIHRAKCNLCQYRRIKTNTKQGHIFTGMPLLFYVWLYS